jgi:hypothetical protein
MPTFPSHLAGQPGEPLIFTNLAHDAFNRGVDKKHSRGLVLSTVCDSPLEWEGVPP